MAMWPMSDRVRKALPNAPTVATRAEILEGDDVIYDLTANGVFLDGTVSVSRSEVQRSASGVTLVDRDGTLSPRDANDLLAPVGNQLRLWRGIMFDPPPAGRGEDVELAPIGTFRFTVTNVTWPVVELAGLFDRSWIVARATAENVMYIPQGSLITDAAQGLLDVAYPGVPTNFPVLDGTTNGMTLDAGTNLWQTAQNMFANIGHRLYFDPMGTAVAVPEASVDGHIDWTYDDASGATIPGDNMGLAGMGASMQGDTPNVFIVEGENTDLAKAVRAVARDLDPLSPTYYGGKYGRIVAEPIRDETLSSQGQAEARAQIELAARLGFSQAISTPTMVNPWLELGVVAQINLARNLANPLVVGAAVLDQFNVPMRAAGEQLLEFRARRIAVTD